MDRNQFNHTALERMFDELAQNNWAYSGDVFTLDFCKSLAQECQRLSTQGQLQKASIGHGASKGTHAEIRGDFTYWLDEKETSPVQQQFLASLQSILENLNSAFYLGLKRYETHFALYPPGAHYDKHIDNHKGSGARKVTFILYLNEHWEKGHGGELEIYDPENQDIKIAQVEPRLGTFVLFRSELFPHQVAKSIQPRLSLTGWFRDDAS
ncbi:2OG-Fe(II) oxygenase [Bdellovibrio reynosensis]|uniref:2OG-Fe(II) oxygenase n=1 Tax=Bdellovibrio reynosensis TaxID=2835041 RepID=A0ABY4CA30_9BACT|nr:2OG-Fe(II) oxygenase [Bdellovibrio reynosensis]UOF01599.1 2OG-Fe(II) oxygenase [Bdellovibrio reynosensis]